MGRRVSVGVIAATTAVLLACVGVLGSVVAPVSADPPVVGEDWTARTVTGATYFAGIASGNGVFVAVGGLAPYTSTDGVTWTPRTVAGAIGWGPVTFGGGQFLARALTGATTYEWMSSTDGVSWTVRGAAGNNVSSLTYGNGLFVAVGSSGVNRVMTSPDGITWTARSAAAANTWWSVTYGNGLFVAVASDGANRVMTSPDGITWTARGAASAKQWNSVTYGNGLFVAVAIDGAVMTSPDGVNWTAPTVPAGFWWTVTYGNGLFVVANYYGTPGVITSPDGVNWTSRTTPSAMWLASSSTDGMFVVVGLDPVSGGPAVMTSGSLASVPSAPTSVVATAGDGSASIAFTAGADGGAEITKYQYRIGSGGVWTDAVGTTSPLTIGGLSNHQINSIKVRAVNSVGAGAASSYVHVWPRPTGPSITSTVSSNTTGVRVSFSAVTPAGGSMRHYWVYAYAKGTSTVVGSCRSTVAARSCRIGGLVAGTEYDVAVKGFFRLTAGTVDLTTLDSARLSVTVLP